MVRLWLLSDLHLNTVPYPEAFQPARPAFDVLVAAADVWEGSSARAMAIVAKLAGGKPAVFVLGNHESWHRDLVEERVAARHAADRHGVVLLDDGEATCAGVPSSAARCGPMASSAGQSGCLGTRQRQGMRWRHKG